MTFDEIKGLFETRAKALGEVHTLTVARGDMVCTVVAGSDIRDGKRLAVAMTAKADDSPERVDEIAQHAINVYHRVLAA